MPARVAYVGTAVAGEYAAADHAREPGGWIGYVEGETSKITVTAEEDITGVTVTVTVGPNRLVKITAFGTFLNVTAGTDSGWICRLYEGATVIQTLHGCRDNTSDDQFGRAQEMMVLRVLDDVTVTFKLTIERNAAIGAAGYSASTSQPITIIVEDIGPAPEA